MMSQAWHTAAFQRIKKMPKLKNVLDEGPKRASRHMRPVQVDEVRAWLANAPKMKRQGR